MHRSKSSARRRQREPECLGRLEVDDQLESGLPISQAQQLCRFLD
jgi:hypothetical protein